VLAFFPVYLRPLCGGGFFEKELFPWESVWEALFPPTICWGERWLRGAFFLCMRPTCIRTLCGSDSVAKSAGVTLSQKVLFTARQAASNPAGAQLVHCKLCRICPLETVSNISTGNQRVSTPAHSLVVQQWCNSESTSVPIQTRKHRFSESRNYRTLLQNIVSFIGLFCKRDLKVQIKQKRVYRVKTPPSMSFLGGVGLFSLSCQAPVCNGEVLYTFVQEL